MSRFCLLQSGHFRPATFAHMGTPGVEGAPRGEIRQICHLSTQTYLLGRYIRIRVRDGCEQRCRIRVPGSPEEGFLSCQLNDLSGIHQPAAPDCGRARPSGCATPARFAGEGGGAPAAQSPARRRRAPIGELRAGIDVAGTASAESGVAGGRHHAHSRTPRTADEPMHLIAAIWPVPPYGIQRSFSMGSPWLR